MAPRVFITVTMLRLSILALIVALSLALAPRVDAHAATATLAGRVVDETGAVVAHVDVVIVDLATGLERKTETSERGEFVLPGLAPARYQLTAQRDGFAPLQVPDLVLQSNDETVLHLTLKISPIGEVVIVDANRVRVNPSPAVSTFVDRTLASHLPLNARSVQSLIWLVPGMVRTSGSGYGQFSANGQRDNANYLTIDGASANVSAGHTIPAAGGGVPATSRLGTTNNLISIDALEDVRIQTSSYAAEFGRTPGAQIALTTRSGTNHLHGVAFEYLRHDAFDANDWFANSAKLEKPALRHHQFGGVLGGPFVRNRAFFFGAYEGLRLRQPSTIVTAVPSMRLRETAAPALRPLLQAFPVPTRERRDWGAGSVHRGGLDAGAAGCDERSSRLSRRCARHPVRPLQLRAVERHDGRRLERGREQVSHRSDADVHGRNAGRAVRAAAQRAASQLQQQRAHRVGLGRRARRSGGADAIGRADDAAQDALLGALLQRHLRALSVRRTGRAGPAGQHRRQPDHDRRRACDQAGRRHQAPRAVARRARLPSGGVLRHGSGHPQRRRLADLHRDARAPRARDAQLLGVCAGYVARRAARHADSRRALGGESGGVRSGRPASLRGARHGRSLDGARRPVAGRGAALSHAAVELRAARGRLVSARRAWPGLGHGAARRRRPLLRSRQRIDAVGVRCEPAVLLQRHAIADALSALGRGRRGAAARVSLGDADHHCRGRPEPSTAVHVAVERGGRAIARPAPDADGHLRRRRGTAPAAARVLRITSGRAFNCRRIADHERRHVLLSRAAAAVPAAAVARTGRPGLLFLGPRAGCAVRRSQRLRRSGSVG